MGKPLDLPAFTAEIPHHADHLLLLPPVTRWRYRSGQLPDAVRWLLLAPELLEALARDARALTDEDRAALTAEVAERKPRNTKPGPGRPKKAK
jgi:hypothetical protein